LDDSGNPLPGNALPVLWDGYACEYQNISTDFHLLFWTSVLLIIAVIVVISSVARIGDVGVGYGGGSSGGHRKTE